jgi:negative regulator of flagellin synthesis FlgM
MMIDKIGSVDPLQNNKKAEKVETPQEKEGIDSVSFSKEAVKKGDLYNAIELVSKTSEVRTEKVAELKKKIHDPQYINETLIQKTADKIMDAFGL